MAMWQGRARSWAVVGGLVTGAVLAGCSSGSSRGQAASPASTPPVNTPRASTPAVSTAPATAAGSGSPSGSPVLITHAFGGSVGYDGRKPSTIDISGDASNIVGHLTWSSWGPAIAVGHGSLAVNNCQPNCAQGTITQTPATIRLGSVAGGHFTAMAEQAGSIVRRYTYPSDWVTGAS